jgi:hypothetical protein
MAIQRISVKGNMVMFFAQLYRLAPTPQPASSGSQSAPTRVAALTGERPGWWARAGHLCLKPHKIACGAFRFAAVRQTAGSVLQ